MLDSINIGASEPISIGEPDIPSQPQHTIIRVAPENVMPLWPQVEPLIRLGMRGIPTHEPEDVRLMLMDMRAHLWIQWSGKVDAVVVTQFMVYPRGCWLLMWVAGAARGAHLDYQAFDAVTEEFRRANGCRGREIRGRIGWVRKFSQADMEAVVLREMDRA